MTISQRAYAALQIALADKSAANALYPSSIGSGQLTATASGDISGSGSVDLDNLTAKLNSLESLVNSMYGYLTRPS